jgi:hypothetical protein
LTNRHGELVAQLRGNGLPIETAPFARHEERHVNRFLNVPAGLLQNLPHLACHVARELLFAFGKNLRRAEQHLGTTWSGNQAPVRVCALRCSNRVLGIGRRGLLEYADQVVRIRGIPVLEEAA